MIKLRAEHELLQCIARKSLDEHLIDRVSHIVEQNLNWDYLLQTASAHGLLPLLANHLLNTVGQLSSKPILQRLKAECVDARKSSLYLLGELLRLLELFKNEHIRILVFKGPILSSQLYGDIGLRQAGDLDLLIAKQDFPRAKALLESDRYRMEPQLTPAQQRSHLHFHCEIPFCSLDQFCVVDLHWGLTPKSFPFPMAFEDLWASRKTITLAGQAIQTFSDADLLLYLCVHGAKHYWIKLEWVASVAELARRSNTLDWSVVLRAAEETNTQRILKLGLLLATELLNIKLPRDVADWLKRSPDVRRCARRMKEGLFLNTGAQPTQLRTFRLNLQFMDRKRDAITGFLGSIFIPTISDWQKVHVPDALYPLYYGLRPFWLLKKYGTRGDT